MVALMKTTAPQNLQRAILKQSLRKDDARDEAFREVIRSVPSGRVTTYGKVAVAAGYPLYHRAVARLLRASLHEALPWQRVVGAGGEIKLREDAALEQRTRLEQEGVQFKGKKIDMDIYEHPLRPWE